MRAVPVRDRPFSLRRTGVAEGGETPRSGSTTVILYTDDLAAAEAAVVKAGGVVSARHEFPGGKRFHFLDTVGNELAVWTKAE